MPPSSNGWKLYSGDPGDRPAREGDEQAATRITISPTQDRANMVRPFLGSRSCCRVAVAASVSNPRPRQRTPPTKLPAEVIEPPQPTPVGSPTTRRTNFMAP
ncbi:MAG: hypothetical protein U0792_24280 [Gemmataceae bacterium]